MQEAGRRNRYCKGHQTWRGWVWWAARCVMGAIGVWRAGVMGMGQGAAEGMQARWRDMPGVGRGADVGVVGPPNCPDAISSLRRRFR